MTEKIKIFAIVGPTASGKSALALELAKRHGGEIISCDSMQIYKRMNIGTAKPTAQEQSEVRHHLIDIIEPDVPFSCEDYVKYAEDAISDCISRGKMPIICGGTGLYLDTLLRGGNSAPVADTSELRAKLTARAEIEGSLALHAELAAFDRESAEAIHPNNVKRVIRALEIYYSCGIPKSVLDKQSKSIESRYDATVLGLRYADREILYRRIGKRVDLMIEQGLLAETEMLMREGVFEKNSTAAQAIGYKELLGYLKGDMSLEHAIGDLKTATRRYAKRQVTWFSAKDYVLPLDATDENGIKRFEEIVNNADKLFSV
ncbi:MAG: tRNA (adenosine(37)-N6)-dimethylallyltransferase MiaA [Clostridia bacterium]|nr:tRNA (adenosine(37)-N6)-dimethylallyltransferase MiaA [Clostridia bacterium]